VPLAGNGLENQSQDLPMTSPYLDRPLFALPVVLPWMLKKIETELANEQLKTGLAPF
jgi:hypothetical protein